MREQDRCNHKVFYRNQPDSYWVCIAPKHDYDPDEHYMVKKSNDLADAG